MCFFSQLTKPAKQIESRFRAKFSDPGQYKPGLFHGFTFPYTPVITSSTPDHISLFRWGLIPSWSKDEEIQKYTLNARYETLSQKPAFRGCLNNRCLILTEGFYEWQWLDVKGKHKQKYFISYPGKELFAFAGLWSSWVSKETGELLHTYTIITLEANPQLATIHNSKKRMPWIVHPETEHAWLDGSLTQPEPLPELIALTV